jgi:hypothetical protein
VLLDAAPDDPPDIPARSVDVLRAEVHQADMALREADYATVVRLLTTAIGELYVHTATGDEVEPHIGDDPFGHQVYGVLRLSSALASQINDGRFGFQAAGGLGQPARMSTIGRPAICRKSARARPCRCAVKE